MFWGQAYELSGWFIANKNMNKWLNRRLHKLGWSVGYTYMWVALAPIYHCWTNHTPACDSLSTYTPFFTPTIVIPLFCSLLLYIIFPFLNNNNITNYGKNLREHLILFFAWASSILDLPPFNLKDLSRFKLIQIQLYRTTKTESSTTKHCCIPKV